MTSKPAACPHGSQSLRAVLPVHCHSFQQIWFAQTDGECACRSAFVEPTSERKKFEHGREDHLRLL